MYPILFESDAAEWTSFGIGVLSDAISCEVEEKRNGEFELEMTYPITGAHFGDIMRRRLIVAKPNYTDNPQPFRIYKISKPLNGKVTVNAEHISYDLSGYIDAPFQETGIQAAMGKMLSSSVMYPTTCPFTFSSDISSTKVMKLAHPESVRSLMGGVSGSLIDTYGGEWHFDGYNCELKSQRGENRGVVIRYGKNLTDLKQEENNQSVYTGVYPYYYNADANQLVTLDEKVVSASGTFGFTKILPLDLSSEFTDAPTKAQLRARAEEYVTSNQIGVPKVNLTIGFLEMDELAQRVDLCDTVAVVFDKLGVATTAKCIRTKWDVLKARYIEAELGSARNSLASTIANTTEVAHAIEERTSQFRRIVDTITSKVTGNSGGNIVLNDTDGDGEPDEILVMDTDDKSTAVHVMRINNAGIAFSNTGYQGTYTSAWTLDGEFVADFIASGEIQTDKVTILGDTYFTWEDANITITDPEDTNKMIRLGLYDGVNYGLGFTVDGGSTWTSGYDFNGIRLMGSVGSKSKIVLQEDYMMINNSSGVTIFYVGKDGGVVDTDGSIISEQIWRIGTVRSGASHGKQCIAIGRYVNPSGAYCISIGYYSTGSANYATAVGYYAEASAENAMALGKEAKASASNGIAIGTSSKATGGESIAIGRITEGTGGYAVVIGYSSKCEGYEGVALGSYSSASGSNSLAIGTSSNATSKFAIAIGDATVYDDYGIAIGSLCRASNDYAVAIGYANKAQGINSIALGFSNTAYNKDAVIVGSSNTIYSKNSCLIGCDNHIIKNKDEDRDHVIIGALNRIEKLNKEESMTDCILIGQLNKAHEDYDILIGFGLTGNTYSQTIFGQYNVDTNDYGYGAFVWASGSSSSKYDAAYLTRTGNLTIKGTLSQNSDKRLKTISGTVPDVSGIRAIRFKWNEKKVNRDDRERIGYIAQDVEEVAPYLVDEDASGYKTLDYIGFLCAKIENLEQKLAMMAEKIDRLEAQLA